MTKIIEHHDKIGRLLQVGDYVAYPDSNMLKIGKIDKINPKMIRVTTGSEWRTTVNKYPEHTVKMDSPEFIVYLLKR